MHDDVKISLHAQELVDPPAMGTPEAGKLFLQALTGSGLDADSFKEHSIFDTVALQTIRDIKAYEGRLTCIIPVELRVQNRYETLHGGCIGKPICSKPLSPADLSIKVSSSLRHPSSLSG